MTFFPDDEVCLRLAAIVAEFDHVIVIDNGSPADARAQFANAHSGRVEVFTQSTNVGLAAALNIGLKRALALGFRWSVIFDQDSKPMPGFASALWATHERNPRAAVIGSRIVEADREKSSYRWVRRNPRWPGVFQRVACDGGDLSEVTMVISSGSLIELETWSRLGGFDEGLFIDYVDTDYCLKVIRSGGRVAVSAGAALQHHLGQRSTGRLLGRDLRPMHHAAFRHYYMARNRVHLWRRHALAVPHWALFDFCFAGLNWFRVLAFETNKWRKWKAILIGTWAGLLGRSGPCPERLRKKFETPPAVR